MFGSGSSRSWCKTHLISESISGKILDAEYYTLRDDTVVNSTNDFPKVLLINYSGANNTGAEARLITLIDELRELFGPGVHITVPTLNENNLKRSSHRLNQRLLRVSIFPLVEPLAAVFYKGLDYAIYR